jgi:hypothetical protein
MLPLIISISSGGTVDLNDSVIEEKRNRPEKNLLIVLLVIAKFKRS